MSKSKPRVKLTEKEEKRFVAAAKQALYTGLDESWVMVGVLDGMKPLSVSRLEFCLQVGHCLLAGKPIIFAAPHGAELPEKLMAAATVILRYDPDDMETLHDNLAALLEKVEAGVIRPH